MEEYRVVMLIRNTNPEFYGGGETYQLMQAEEMKKYKIRPIIITSSNKLVSEAKKNGIEVVRAPFLREQNFSGIRNLLLPKYLMWQRKLKRWYGEIFDKYKPVTVNIQSRDDFIAATDAAMKRKMKVLWTDHMDFRSWVFQNINARFKNQIGKMILRRAPEVDKVIMISDFEAKFYRSVVPVEKRKNLVVIKNGVIDKSAEYRDVRCKKQSICYVGRVVDYKGISELVRAFLDIQEKFPKAELNIYGDGDLIGYKREAKDSKQIHFYGRTDKPFKAMAENEIFVLPSYREGLSLSLLEAAMMGKKIIASNVDGNPEVVKDNETGILVPAKNVDKLSDAMLKMLTGGIVMAKNARALYKKEFDFDEIFKNKILPLYNGGKEKE